MYSNNQVEDALRLFDGVDMLDLGDFLEDQHSYIGQQFKILVEAGVARGLRSVQDEYPIACDLKVAGKMWRDQMFRKDK